MTDTDVRRYQEPQTLCALGIIALYTRKSIPNDNVVEVMSLVVEFIEGFDKQSKHTPTKFTESLKRLDTQILSSIQTYLWQIENLDDLFKFFKSLDDSVIHPESATPHFIPLPLQHNSLLGGFVLDCIQAFNELDFTYKRSIWNSFVAYRNSAFENTYQEFNFEQNVFLRRVQEALSENEPIEYNHTEDKLEKLDKAAAEGDVHTRLTELHKIFDQNRHLAPQEALVNLAAFYKSVDNIKAALDCSEQAIVVARRNNDEGTILENVSWIYSMMKSFPDIELPRTFGNKSQLWQYLTQACVRLDNPALKLMVAQLDLLRAAESGAHCATVLEKMFICLQLIPASQLLYPDLDLNFHAIMYNIWHGYGKGELAECHMAIIRELIRKNADLDHISIAKLKCNLVLSKGLDEGFTEDALQDLEDVKPTHIEAASLWKFVKLLLRVTLLTKRGRFQAAQKVLEILQDNPPQDLQIKRYVERCEFELYLNRSKNVEAYDISISRYNAAATSGNNDHMYEASNLLSAAKALYSLSESSQEVRGLEAMQLADRAFNVAMKVNQIPIAIDSRLLAARVHVEGREFEKALEICDKYLSKAVSCKVPRLHCEIYLLKATCLFRLTCSGQFSKEKLIEACNKAFGVLEEYSACEFNGLNRRYSELRHDLLRDLDIPLPELPECKVSCTTGMLIRPDDQGELKRKAHVRERRPSKRHKSVFATAFSYFA